MTELLILLLVAAAYALGRARDERDRLLRALHERRSGRLVERPHWQPIEQQLEAERQIWRQTAAVHRAARQAMRDVAQHTKADPPRPPDARTARPRRSEVAMSPASPRAEQLRRAVKESGR
jgi:hypothetical protein